MQLKISFFFAFLIALYFEVFTASPNNFKKPNKKISTLREIHQQQRLSSHLLPSKPSLLLSEAQSTTQTSLDTSDYFNTTLSQQIQDQIVQQLNTQIAGDTSSQLIVTDSLITLTTSLDIIISDIFIDQSVYVSPISITSSKSITITNITAYPSEPEITLYISLYGISSLPYWFTLSAPQILISNFSLTSYGYDIQYTRVIPFEIQNSKVNVRLCNVTLIGHSTAFLFAQNNNQMTLQSVNVQDFNEVSGFQTINLLNVITFSIFDSLFSGFYLGDSSALRIESGTDLIFNNVTFTYNIINCSQQASCSLIDASKINRISFNSVNATQNFGLSGYVLLQASQIGYFMMSGSTFSQNIYAQNVKGGLLRVSSRDYSSQFCMITSIIEYCGSSSFDNYFTGPADVVGYFKAIQLDMPNIIIIKSIFSNNQGGVLDLINTSQLSMEYSVFDQNVAYYAPVLNIRSNQLESLVYIHDSNFTSNQAICTMLGNGGAINVDFLTQLKIESSLFLNNTSNPGLYGGAIYFQEIQTFLITTSEFKSNSATQNGGAIYGRIVSTTLNISQSTFSFNKAFLSGGAISISEIVLLSIQNCTISSNIAFQSGGFINVETIYQVMMINYTTFSDNYAAGSTGGAIFVSDQASWIQLINTQAHMNQAQVGGFIGFNLLSTLTINGMDDQINPTNFSNNIAQIGGGVFYGTILGMVVDGEQIDQKDIDSEIQELMSDNCAMKAGDGSFVSPAQFELVGVYEFQKDIGNECQLPLSFTKQTPSGQIQGDPDDIIIATYTIQSANSNSVVKLKISYSDNYNLNALKSSSSGISYSNITLDTAAKQQYLATITIDTTFEDDDQILNGLITETASQCGDGEDKGFFYLNYQLNYIPDSTLNTTITFFNQLSSTVSMKIQWQFRKCVVGEIYIEQGGNPLCFACPYHTYSFSDPYNGKSCIPIPTQGVSESYKNVLNLTAGFWRNDVDSADILECNNAREFCIGGIEANNMLCADGHIGPLCEQCDLQGIYWSQPYTPSHNYQCQKCSDISYNLEWMIFASVAAMIFCVIVCRSTYKNTLNTILGHYMRSMGVCMLGNSIIKQNLFSVYAKIFLSYLQISQVLYNFQIKPFGIFTAMLNAISQPVSTTLMSLDCFITNTTENTIIFTKMIIVALLPIAFVGLIILFINSLHLFGLVSSQQKKHSLFATTLYCLVNLLQFNIVLFFLQARACRKIGSDYVAFLDLTIQCDNSSFENFKYFLIYPLLAYWTTILPLTLLYFLYTRRNKLYSCIDIQFKLRFLYAEYKQTFFYWELLRLTKRMAIAYAFTEFYSQSSISGLNILFILIVYETAVIRYAPFSSKQINYLEAESIFIAMFNIFLAMLYDNIRDMSAENDSNYSKNQYSYFWSENSFITGLIVAIIQLSNCYLVIKYIYISIYALLEHHRFVRKIEDKIRRKWPRFAAIVCKIRTNSILVSMRWTIVKKLIISGRIFTLKSRSNEFYNNNPNIQSLFQSEKSIIDALKINNTDSGLSSKSEIKHRRDRIQEEIDYPQNDLHTMLLCKDEKQQQ